MSSSARSEKSSLSCGLVAAAAFVATSQLMMATGVEGFSIVSARRTGDAGASSRALASSHHSNPLRGSLRDLIESSGDDNKSQRDANDSQDAVSVPGGADDFSNLLNFSRSKFSDTKFRSRSIYGTGGSDYDDERGLHVDRLSTFSFAGTRGNVMRSLSEGGAGLVGDDDEEKEEEFGEEVETSTSNDDSEEMQSDDSTFDEAEGNVNISEPRRRTDPMIGVDNFNDMAGIHYSKQAAFPARKRSEISDEADALGQHKDRLSTFSFSSKSPLLTARSVQSSVPVEETLYDDNDANSGQDDGIRDDLPATVKNEIDESSFGVDNFHNSINLDTARISPLYGSRPNPGASPDGLDNHSDRLSTFSLSSPKDEKEDDDQPLEGAPPVSTAAAAGSASSASNGGGSTTTTTSFGVDNFHNSINFDTSRAAPLSNPPNPNMASPDGLDNHFDRLTTFSLSSAKEDKDVQQQQQQQQQPMEMAPSSGVAAGGASAAVVGSGSRGPSAAVGGSSSSASTYKNVQQFDRLGTFSFGSTTNTIGTTSIKGTTNSSPVTNTAEFNIENEPPKTNIENEPNIMASNVDQVYSSPQKGSLSSIASSVSTVTRNDRIKKIKEKTDPKLLHPDGMNVPRLNSKGEVMSMSKTSGKMNIFQRIEQQAAAEQTGGGEEMVGDGAAMVDGVGNEESDDVIENSAISTANDETVDDSLEYGDCFIGFDLGTSGARMSIIEKKASPDNTNDAEDQWYYQEVLTEALAWDDKLQFDNAKDWRSAIDTLLSRARGSEVMSRVKAICVSGTSATCLLVNRDSLDVSRGARMYNYDILSSSASGAKVSGKGGKSKKKKASSPADRVMELIDEYVPEKHTARATTGSLAKLLLWNEESSIVDDDTNEVQEVLCHQSDYVSMSLVQEGTSNEQRASVTSDWHNCLKLGYDVRKREFPEWMHKLLKEGANIPEPESVLPSRVISPGEPFGIISPSVASKYGLSSNVMLVGGTTDSNAAFFAAAGAKPEFGTAVTSLGSTLAMKQLSREFVEDASRGVYSHRFPRFGDGSDSDGDGDEEAWLIGGASNVGCAVLRQEGFSNEELSRLSAEIDPRTDSPLSYYPLSKKGERFPVADSQKEPILEPKPDSRREYLHAILQGIGDVERDGFRILGELGASPIMPKVVLSCGGGSKNDMWIAMRKRRLRDLCKDGDEVEVKRAENTEASYGAALLAAASFEE